MKTQRPAKRGRLLLSKLAARKLRAKLSARKGQHAKAGLSTQIYEEGMTQRQMTIFLNP